MEHLRIAQWDILEFSRNPKHVSPECQPGTGPTATPRRTPAPGTGPSRPSGPTWGHADLVADPETDLFAPIPHGEGQTVLREALLVADHNAYHLGQLVTCGGSSGRGTAIGA